MELGRTIWSDGMFDYFRTSDGHLYRVPRNLAREAAEARFKRTMYRLNIMNKALLYLMFAVCGVDLVFLALLICFGGAR